jgi:hypothetical protein
LTTRGNEWLPFDALADPRIMQAVEACVEQWSIRWFGHAVYRPVKQVLRPPSERRAVSTAQWRVFGSSFFFDVAESQVSDIARLALDAPDGDVALQPADKALMTRFGDMILQDLATAMRQAWQLAPFECTHPFAGPGGLNIQIAGSGNVPPLSVGVPIPALVPFRKSLIQSLLPVEELAGPLEDYFEAESMAFSVILGESPISLAGLTTLAVGDILVLDAALLQPVPCISRLSGRKIGAATLSNAGETIQLFATFD